MHALILFMVAVAADQQLKQLTDKMAADQQLKQLTDKMAALQRKQVEVAWAQGRERTCAIPLINALKGKMPPNPMPIKKPEGTFHIRQVVPPAPSCDDTK